MTDEVPTIYEANGTASNYFKVIATKFCLGLSTSHYITL
jgi:hypothetical protein